jgi:hypothetical protein
MIYIVIIIVSLVFILFYFFNLNSKETFVNSNYKNQRLPYKVKEDVYMKFLGDLNDAFNIYVKEANKDSKSPIPQRVLCNDIIRKQVQTKALINAFKKVPEKDINKDSQLFDNSIPKDSKIRFIVNDNRTCGNKASHLCELTNPMLYLSQNTYFPPRWIGPYKDTPLPKHTDLKCWNNMLNCCKNNF